MHSVEDLDAIYNVVMAAYDDEEMALDAQDRAAKAWVDAETAKQGR